MNQEIAEIETTAELASQCPDFTVLLSSTPRGARLARLLAEAQPRRWELPTETASHVAAELAANAATHGRVPRLPPDALRDRRHPPDRGHRHAQ